MPPTLWRDQVRSCPRSLRMLRVVFEGLGAGAVAWFEALDRENTKAYFDATRDTFEIEVREPFEDMLEDLREEFAGEPKVFRQHRDIRFSKDKSSYKTRTYGVLHSRPESAAGLYAEVSARGLYAGTGYWRMEGARLERYRDAVLEHGAALEEAIAGVEDAGLELAAPALKTAPRGMPRDHAHVALLRYKDMIAGRRLPAGPALTTREALEHVAATWRAAAPLTGWLDTHVGG